MAFLSFSLPEKVLNGVSIIGKHCFLGMLALMISNQCSSMLGAPITRRLIVGEDS